MDPSLLFLFIFSEKLNLQEHPLQHKEAGEDSYSSGSSTFISPPNKQSGAGKERLLHRMLRELGIGQRPEVS